MRRPCVHKSGKPDIGARRYPAGPTAGSRIGIVKLPGHGLVLPASSRRPRSISGDGSAATELPRAPILARRQVQRWMLTDIRGDASPDGRSCRSTEVPAAAGRNREQRFATAWELVAHIQDGPQDNSSRPTPCSIRFWRGSVGSP
jgi:hypothetical protein